MSQLRKIRWFGDDTQCKTKVNCSRKKCLCLFCSSSHRSMFFSRSPYYRKSVNAIQAKQDTVLYVDLFQSFICAAAIFEFIHASRREQLWRPSILVLNFQYLRTIKALFHFYAVNYTSIGFALICGDHMPLSDIILILNARSLRVPSAN